MADLRATLGDGHLEPLDIVAAYYIADNTCASYVFSIQELESVRLATLLGRPKPDFRQSIRPADRQDLAGADFFGPGTKRREQVGVRRHNLAHVAAND